VEDDDLCLCFYLIVRIVGCYVIFIYSLLFLIVWCNLLKTLNKIIERKKYIVIGNIRENIDIVVNV